MSHDPVDVSNLESPMAASTPPARSWRDVIDNPWLVLVMLFLVTAALGLPFLWMSRGFSTLGKIILTIAVLAWTALALWLTWLVMLWSYTRVVDAL